MRPVIEVKPKEVYDVEPDPYFEHQLAKAKLLAWVVHNRVPYELSNMTIEQAKWVLAVACHSSGFPVYRRALENIGEDLDHSGPTISVPLPELVQLGRYHPELFIRAMNWSNVNKPAKAPGLQLAHAEARQRKES